MNRVSAYVLLLLAFVCVCVCQPSSAQTGSGRAAQVRQRVETILQSSEFTVRPHEKSVQERIGDWVRETWQKIVKVFSGLGFSPSVSPGMSQVIYILVMAAVIILGSLAIAWLVVRLSDRERRKSTLPKRADTTFEELAANSTPAELLAQAEQLAAHGQHRLAYRLAFLASLKQLDVIGALRFDPSRTNGEVVQILRSKRALHALMRPASLDFDVRWYGGEEVREEDFKRVASLTKLIEQASPS